MGRRRGRPAGRYAVLRAFDQLHDLARGFRLLAEIQNGRRRIRLAEGDRATWADEIRRGRRDAEILELRRRPPGLD